MAVVLQHDEVQGLNLAVRRVAGDHVHLPLRQRPVRQPQVHRGGWGSEPQSVYAREPPEAVGALQELVAESGLPARRHARQVGDALQAVARGVAVSHGDGEGVVESERFAPDERESLRVIARNGAIHAVAIGDERVLQHGGVRGSRVFDVEIDLARRDRVVAHERAAEVKAPLYGEPRAPLDLLRHDLAQQIGLGEVLGANHYPVALGASRQQQGDQAERPPRPARRSPSPEGRGGGQGVRTHLARHANRRSATPSSPSAASAISAAGSAPARMRVSSTTATPRKMYTPSPPAPMAAAMVAVPTLTTVATRTPARITPKPSGNSTCVSSCQSVIPIPRPASRTAGSTPVTPS